MEEQKQKNRILIVGATGRLGRHLAEFSLRSSHPTFALVRSSSFSLAADSLRSLSAAGLTILKVTTSLSLYIYIRIIWISAFWLSRSLCIAQGSLEDEQSLVEAVKQVDVVISAVPSKEALSQKLLIKVINQSGSIKVSFAFLFLFYQSRD